MEKFGGEALSEDVLVRETGRDTVAKGQRVLASGAVRSLVVSGDGTRISASVASERRGYGPRAPYQQTISISPRAGRLRVVGYCTCPMGHNCKHVAAALLEHLARSGTASETGMATASRTVVSEVPRQPQPPALIEPPAPISPLSSEVVEWLERMGQAFEAASPAASDALAARATGNARALLYVLAPRNLARGVLSQHAIVRAVGVRLRRDGPPTDPKPYSPENVMRHESQRARYMKPEDLAILRDLYWLQHSRAFVSHHDVALPPNASGRYVLEVLIATGRLHWGAIDGPALTAGPATAGEPRWTTDAIGRQRLAIVPS
ncbi:MAG: SWIM zinc finger family protein, partial [Alphaproteobacteria bacterium]|nr:SWIM zinc finger family protein [Alphaproteobacteria bacterium]